MSKITEPNSDRLLDSHYNNKQSESESASSSNHSDECNQRVSDLESNKYEAAPTNHNSKKSIFMLNPSRLKPSQFESVTTAKCDPNESQKSFKNDTCTSDEVKFVPLVPSTIDANTNHNITTSSKSTITATSSSSSSSSTSSSAFVFGQNLEERVVSVASPHASTSSQLENSTANEPVTPMLFSKAVRSNNIENTVETNTNKNETKSLLDTVREYEATRATTKRKYEEVTIVTGEEEETNILNFTCKLFAFDKTLSTWQERGRGNLRLNDSKSNEKTSYNSRLVIRTVGNFRVVLNTKIWSDMNVELVSEKGLRFTAMNSSGEIKIFLILAGPDDCKQLHSHLLDRIQKERETTKGKKLLTDD